MAWFYPGKIRGQSSMLTILKSHPAGMMPLDVIRAVTCNAADMLGWGARIGISEDTARRGLLKAVCRRRNARCELTQWLHCAYG